MAQAKPIASPLTVSGLERAAGERADEGGGEGRAAGAGGAAGPARDVPARRRCGRARRSRSATPTGTCARARSAPSPTSTATGCGSSATSSRASAGARCCCRTRTSSGSSTTRCSSGQIALDVQARGLRARPRDGHLGRVQRGRRAHRRRCRTRCRSSVIAARRGREARPVVNTQRGRRGRRRPAERRLVDVVRSRRSAVTQAASSVLGSTPGAADRRDVRADRARRDQEAAALLQPLRVHQRRPERRRRRPSNAVLSGAANDLGGALATIDAYTGKPPRVTGVNVLLKLHRGADQAFMRGVSLPARVRPGQRVRAQGRAAARARRQAHPHLHAADPARRPHRPPARALRRPGRRPGRRTPSRRSSSATTTSRTRAATPARRRSTSSPSRSTRRARYDGVGVRIGRARGEAFRDADFRISGQAETTVRSSRASRRR